MDVTTETFQAEVLDATVPVLVDLWAERCGPCRAFMPTFRELEAEADGRYKAVKVNVDDHPELAGQLGISAIPTLIVFKNGQEFVRFVGIQTKQKLLDVLTS